MIVSSTLQSGDGFGAQDSRDNGRMLPDNSCAHNTKKPQNYVESALALHFAVLIRTPAKKTENQNTKCLCAHRFCHALPARLAVLHELPAARFLLFDCYTPLPQAEVSSNRI